MKKFLSFTNITWISFLLFFSFEPMFEMSEVYLYLLLALGAMAVIAFIVFAFAVIGGYMSIERFQANYKKMSLPCALIYINGTIIGYVYESTLFKVWLSFLIFELICICIRKRRKR